MVTLGKKGDLPARRLAISRLHQVDRVGGILDGYRRNVIQWELRQHLLSEAGAGGLEGGRVTTGNPESKAAEHRSQGDDQNQLLGFHWAAVFLRLIRALAASIRLFLAI